MRAIEILLLVALVGVLRTAFGQTVVFDPTSYQISFPDQAVSSVTTSDNAYVYIAAGTAGVYCYSISNLSSITLVSSANKTSSRARRLTFLENETKLAVAFELGGFQIFDISNKFRGLVPNLTQPIYSSVIASYEETLILGTQTVLYSYSKSSNEYKDKIHQYDAGAFIRNIRIFVRKTVPLIFIALGEQGVQVVRLSDFMLIAIGSVSQSETFDLAADPQVDYLYASLTIYGIDRFDMSLLDNPLLGPVVNLDTGRTSVLSNSNYYYSVFIRNQRLYASSYSGVEIFQLDPASVTDPLILIEQIILPGDTTWIYVDPKESLIFSTKNHALNINQRTKPALLNIDDMPNLMNSHHQVRYGIKSNLLNIAWICLLFDSYTLVAPYDHLYIFDISTFKKFTQNSYVLKFTTANNNQPVTTEPVDPSSIVIPNSEQNFIEALKVNEAKDKLYIAKGLDGLYLYGISDSGSGEKYKLTFIARYKSPGTNFNVNDIAVHSSSGLIYCALGSSGFAAVSYANGSGFTGVSTQPLADDYQNSSIMRVIFSMNEKYLIAGARRYGVLFFDLAGPTNSPPVYKVRTAGGEDFILSKDFKHLFVADFLSGFSIISLNTDSSGLFKEAPQKVSSILLPGQALMVQTIMNDKYILVGQAGYQMISLIDISNRSNPFLLQSIDSENELMQSFIADETLQVIVMPTTRGIRMIHYDAPFQLFYEINDSLTKEKKSKSDTFMVGQPLSITLTPLILESKFIIDNDIKILQNNKILAAPSYISLKKDKQIVTFTPDKENIGTFVFIIKWLFQVDAVPFVKSGLSKTTADLIIKDGQERGFIDQDFYPTNMVDSLRLWTTNSVKYVDPLVSITESEIKYEIEKVIRDNIAFIPLRLSIISSIVFNKKKATDTDKSPILSSYATEIKVQLVNIDLSIGEFMKNTYEGVSYDLSADKSTITLAGQPFSVSQNLARIRFNCFDLDGVSFVSARLNASSIDITITDNINPKESQSLTFKDIGFITYNEQPTIQKDLQQQFNTFYDNGIIAIEQDFSFSFSSETFLDKDELVYTAFLNKKPIELSSTNSWIHFEPKTMKFTGMATYSQLGSKPVIVVHATDGYYSVEASFEIKLYTIPFYIVFNRVIAFLSGLSGLIVIWKNRGLIHMIICPRKIRLSTEIVKVGDRFEKEFCVVVPFIERCSEFLILYIKYIKQSRKIDLKKPNKFLLCFSQYKHPLELFIHEIEKKDPLQSQSKEEECGLTKINSSPQTPSKAVNFDELFASMKAYTETITSEDRIVPLKWFKRKTHISQQILVGLVNHMFMTELDKDTFAVYKSLKEKALLRRDEKSKRFQFFSRLDWFQEFAKIEPHGCLHEHTTNMDIHMPKIQISFDKIKRIYLQTKEQIYEELDKNNRDIEEHSFIAADDLEETESLNIPHCNDHLLAENIKAASLGIQKNLGIWTSFVQPIQGCSVHIDPSSINQMKAMIKTQSQGIIRKLKEVISFDYDDLELTLIRKLPQWLKCEWKNGNIILSGTPLKEDVRNYQIRLEDVNGFVLFSFKLLILDGEKWMAEKQILLQESNQKDKRRLSFDDQEGGETLNVMIMKSINLQKLIQEQKVIAAVAKKENNSKNSNNQEKEELKTEQIAVEFSSARKNEPSEEGNTQVIKQIELKASQMSFPLNKSLDSKLSK